MAVRFGSALRFSAVFQFLAHRAHDGSMNIFMNSGDECESVRDGAQSSGAPSGAARPRRAGISWSCRSAAIDTPRRMLCLFAQQSCLMLFAYQGDQHGSDNTCLTPPAFSHQRVDLLSRLLFSGRQFLALSVNGVNNSHQYLI